MNTNSKNQQSAESKPGSTSNVKDDMKTIPMAELLTRTRGPFWSIRPARILWVAVPGTQTIATLIAVYGFFMTPLGWGWTGFVWGYALLWFLVNDRIKLLAYRIFDPVKAPKIN